MRQENSYHGLNHYLANQHLATGNPYLQPPKSVSYININERLSSLNHLMETARSELSYEQADTTKLKVWMNMAVKEEQALFGMLTNLMPADPTLAAKMVQLDALAKKRIQIERMIDHIVSSKRTVSTSTTIKNFNDKLQRRMTEPPVSHYRAEQKLVVSFDYLYNLPETYYSFYLSYYLIDTETGKLLNAPDRTTAVFISKMRKNAFINAVEHLKAVSAHTAALYIELIGVPYARQDQSMGIGWTMLPISIMNDASLETPCYTNADILKRSSANILSRSAEQMKLMTPLYREKLSENVGKFKLPFYHYPIKHILPYPDFKYNRRVDQVYLFIQSKGTLGSDFASQEDLHDLMEKNNRGFAHMSYSMPAIHSERNFEFQREEMNKIATDKDELLEENKRLNQLLTNQQKKLEDLLAIENNEVAKMLKGEQVLLRALKRNPFKIDDEEFDEEDDKAKMARWRAYDEDLKGLNIKLINLCNQQNGDAVKVVMRVVFHDEVLEDDLYQKMAFDTPILKPVQQSKKFNVPIDRSFRIACWLDKLLEVFKGDNIFLEFDVSFKGKVVAWSDFELGEISGDRFVLKTGLHASQLYGGLRQTTLAATKKAKPVPDYLIHFELSEFKYRKEKLEGYLVDPIHEEDNEEEDQDKDDDSVVDSQLDNQRQNKLKKEEEKAPEDEEDPNRPYVINRNKMTVKTPFTVGGIDVYIDEIFFLPDNVSVSKVLVRIVDTQFNDAITPISLHPDGGSSVNKPIFDDKIELRRTSYPTQLFIVIAVLVIEAADVSGEIKILGYAYHPLFLSMAGDKSSSPAKEPSYIHNGHFQLPVYHLGFNLINKGDIDMNVLPRLERIPSLNLLIRIYKAPEEGTKILGVDNTPEGEWEQLKVIQRFPGYITGKYYFPDQPSELEDELYRYRDTKIAVTCKEKSMQILHKLGIDIQHEEIEEDIVYELERFFSKPKPNNDFRYNFHGFHTYVQTVGFSVAVDGIFQTKRKGFFIVMFGVNPPGGFYKDIIQTDNTYFMSEVDWASSSAGMYTYSNNYTSIKQVPFNPKAHLIFTIKEVEFNKKREPIIKDFGFSILPLFSQDEFVYSGAYQLPIFKGDLDQASVTALHNRDPFVSLLESAVRKQSGKRVLQPLEFQSLVVRLKDNMLGPDLFQYRYDVERINTDFLPKNKLPKFILTTKSLEREKAKEKLDSIILKNVAPDEMNYIMAQVIREAYGLSKSD